MTKPQSCFKTEDQQYHDYVKFGDAFFMAGLSFEQWKAAKARIVKSMNKYGSN